MLRLVGALAGARGLVGARAATLALALVGAACSSTPKDAYVERPVEELYNGAMDQLAKSTGATEYRAAAVAFDEVDRQHPYSNWATRSQLMSAYAYYRAGDFDSAILGAQRYLQLHPGSADAAYATYLAAVSLYDQIGDVSRDQAMTQAALDALRQVAARYPNTEYGRDALIKIDLATEHLAGKEMEIGRYYLRRADYLAAINRFRSIIDQYQTTSHVPEALERLTECYLALGVIEEARKAAAVLGYNFPGSTWYQDAYRLLVQAGAAPTVVQDTPEAARKTLMQRMLGIFGG